MSLPTQRQLDELKKPKVSPTTAKPVVVPAKKPVPFNMGDEMKKSGKTLLEYDNNEAATDVVKRVAEKMGVNKSLLFSSAWQEGMNKAALSPDDVSVGYNEAKVPEEFPVDGFLNYGLDTIGDRYKQLMKYLPEGFEKNMFFYKTTNEKNEKVTTAAFKNNEDAITAKAAFMKLEGENIVNYAESKKIPLDEESKGYFMLAAYNGGLSNAVKMMDEYVEAQDKKKFIANGETSLKGVHKNIKVRLENMAVADELLR